MGLPVPQRDLMGWQFKALHHAWLGQILGPKLIALEQLFLRTDTYTQHLHLQVTGVNYFNREWNNNWKVRTNYILNLYFNEKEEHCHFIHKNNLIDNLKKKILFSWSLFFLSTLTFQFKKLGWGHRDDSHRIPYKQNRENSHHSLMGVWEITEEIPFSWKNTELLFKIIYIYSFTNRKSKLPHYYIYSG